MAQSVKIGTRGSQLALWQANWVKSCIEKAHPEISVTLEVVKTKGDKILDVPLAKVGGKGLFVKEIEEALLNKKIDLAVHSMKDMPADIPEGLCIGAIPKRENPRDVLITADRKTFSQLPRGARIGTSSLRRGAQLLIARNDVKIESLRGNVHTRLKKLESEKLDAIVLAAAGVLRLGLAHRICEYLDEAVMMPAVGQGALCVEIRENDSAIMPLMACMSDKATWRVVMGERAFLNRLGGGCQVPIAGHGHIKDSLFTLDGLVASVDGKIVYKDQLSGPAEDAQAIGRQLADHLAAQGAGKIIENLKENMQ